METRAALSAGTFWKLDFTHEISEPYAMSVARTREALIDSVRSHFVSDVPVGVFLSGGVDSTRPAGAGRSHRAERSACFLYLRR